MEGRITPEKITVEMLLENDNIVTVIPTNEAGIHGAGMAQWARRKFALPAGFGFGETITKGGQCFFCIPTKDWKIRQLRLEVIQFYILRFIEYAKIGSNLTFYIPKIGCGLAGYTPEQIAPMFRDCVNLPNVYLPKEFWDVLNKEI